MTTLRLNPGAVQQSIHDELSYHQQFEDAHLNFSEEESFENLLAFYVPNYSGTVDSSTIHEICSRLGPLFTMKSDTRRRRLWIYAHAPSTSALEALRRHKDRVVFTLTSTVWSVPLCIAATLVSIALLVDAACRLNHHWAGYDRPWETLVDLGSDVFQ